VGRALGVLVPLSLPLPSRDAPPFGPGLTPAQSAGRLRDAVLRPVAPTGW